MPVDQLRPRVHALMPQARDDLERLVAYRSVADEAVAPIEECLAAARDVADSFARVGLRDVRLVDMPLGHPAVYGHTPGPPGAPTVLLYSHYDVQPPVDEQAWTSPVFTLTERDGRWYGRGSADCKGNIVMHLSALRALGDRWPVGVKLIVEGSEEQGLNELEDWVPGNRDLLAADAILIGDSGNRSAGAPTLTTTLRGIANVIVTVRTGTSALHSGAFGGAAPDAVAALIAILATLRDSEGNTTVAGVANDQVWPGADYPAVAFRRDAHVLGGVRLLGSGRVSDQVWARPAATILGIDCPAVVGSAPSIQPEARARVSLRVPPGMSSAHAMTSLVAHLRAAAPWGALVDVEEHGAAEPWEGASDGRAVAAMAAALLDAYGVEVGQQGQGGSIPLCTTLQQAFPEAEMMIMGVEEPRSLMHAPNESVDPSEIEHMALAEALFLERMAQS